MREKIYRGSGNVFADLGLPNADELFIRSEFMIRVTQIIRQRGWTQKKAASVLGVSQPKISCLMKGKIDMFSLDRLFGFLNKLDRTVEIIIRPKPKNGKATTHIKLAA
jgi:predicted XRE-type DNA-binding protein